MSFQLDTLQDYYQRISSEQAKLMNVSDFEAKKSHFNIAPRRYCSFRSPYNRRDYYKISLILGKGMIEYDHHQIEISQPTLFLPSPGIPYSWTCGSDRQDGYFCLFNQEFFGKNREFEIFQKTSLFKEWSMPFIFLNDEQAALIELYFEQIYKLHNSQYPLRCNSIRHHLAAILHLALESRSDENLDQNQPANIRLYRLFDELLNRQFPLDSPAYPLVLKTAADFAKELNVHVNHLNSSVKSVTQQTTTMLIKNRIFKESKKLLSYTDWDIAQVGYTLGFEEPAHFNNFFKKYANTSPSKFKLELI